MYLCVFKEWHRVGLVWKFIKRVFPIVEKELAGWIKEIRNFGSDELAYQAMASIKTKKFHCQGGSIYSLYPGCNTVNMVKLIVALQTISDYLDNLCDRAEIQDEQAFRQLHLSFTEALNQDTKKSDYYLYYPYNQDGGYLDRLVDECRFCTGNLPSYKLVKEEVLRLAQLYSELQVYKHLPLDIREKKVTDWVQPYLELYQGVTSWEFAAAAGSTLAIFMLFAAASNPECSENDAGLVVKTYFPWVCGMHILLDYFIDLKEDMQWGDLNFVYYYKSFAECENRLGFFIDKSFENARMLPNSYFHRTVIEGLLALYLSDPKARTGETAPVSRRLIERGGKDAVILNKACEFLRWKKVI